MFRTDPENTDFLVEIGNDVGTPPADLYTAVSHNNIAVPALPARKSLSIDTLPPP